MFTIKTIIDGNTLLTHAAAVRIGREGSDALLDALDVAGEDGDLDTFQHFPETDEELGGSVAIARFGQRYPAHAVIISEIFDESISSQPGTLYQFLYPGDRAFIMNANGQTVDLIK
ncbi:hypothetical protein [Nissabacter sp. SGAir0207]|uniref:hypothetical protein n=1 Tax=Nissabacter sp. SGAir0207 TaxID=2126321 RepID=UPI0010F788C4|nr:hypothetical protein [Nissabacter sp. SGAir0207]